MKNKWTDDAVLAEGRKYSSRTQFATCSPSAYKVARKRKLHLLGEDPKFVGFSGYTEFRALSDSALYAAISMICNQL